MLFWGRKSKQIWVPLKIQILSFFLDSSLVKNKCVVYTYTIKSNISKITVKNKKNVIGNGLSLVL